MRHFLHREQHNLLAGTSDLVPRTPGIEYPGCRYPVLRTSQHVPRTADPDIRHTVPRTSYPYLVTRTPFPTTSYLVRRASKKEEPRSNNGTYHDGASLVGGAFEGGLEGLFSQHSVSIAGRFSTLRTPVLVPNATRSSCQRGGKII